MEITIAPRPLAGAITPPPSKSQAHRAVLALALAEGTGTLSNLAMSQDIQATCDCVAALKSGRPAGEDGLPLLDCGESGSTLRFLIPIALVVTGGGHFTGRGRLMERPQGPYQEIFRERGILWEQKDNVLTVRGRLEAGEYALRGDVSSQFVTGLLYALPLLDGDSEIVLTTPLESRGYVDMTLDVLEQFGVRVENRDYGRFRIPGGQVFRARDLTIEADWSQAAFWYAANFAGCSIDIQGLNARSVQGDMQIAPYFAKLQGAGPVDLDVSQCPDLVPPLAAMAALRDGTTRIVNAARLRMKESDRLASVSQTLNALGASVLEGPDSLTVQGKRSLAGGAAVDSHNDHRIAMMAAVAAVRCEGPVTIAGAECVAKSYPNFWEDYEKLGGEIARSDAEGGAAVELAVKPFGALTPEELYEILRLRVDVFVVEQRCPYPELDGKDQTALHVFLREGGRILAYLRVLPPGVSSPTAALGRVVTRERGRGLGRRILDAGIRAAREKLGADAITIEAQTYARGFYEGAGFRPISGEFLEDGIPHILMRLELEPAPGAGKEAEQ